MEELKKFIRNELGLYQALLKSGLGNSTVDNTDITFYEGHISAYQSVLGYLDEHPGDTAPCSDNWIKVTDRLPENDDEVIVAAKEGGDCIVLPGRYYRSFKPGEELSKWDFEQWEIRSAWDDDYVRYEGVVSHWQPYPEHPGDTAP